MNLAWKALLLALLGLGIAAVAAAVMSWHSFYGDLIHGTGYTLRDALPCLYSSTGMCAIVAATSQLLGKAPYDPTMFWVGIALIGAVIVLGIARGGRR